ncbi:MAG: hypothetical protein WKF94_07915 [Solirubrobacteraceae bacterium]
MPSTQLAAGVDGARGGWLTAIAHGDPATGAVEKVELQLAPTRVAGQAAAGSARWLIKHGRPGSATRLPFYVRDVAELPDSIENIHLAMTGAVAAERLNVPVMTAAPVPTFRADCGPERLEDVPALLRGFRTDSGATAILIADPKRLAHVDARRLDDGTLVAPPSRVMLDLLLERRGEAAAELFADLWRDQR